MPYHVAGNHKKKLCLNQFWRKAGKTVWERDRELGSQYVGVHVIDDVI